MSRRAFVLPGWVLVAVAVLCLGGAGWLGWLIVDETSGGDPVAAPSAGPSPAESSPAEPSPSATPTPSPTTASPSPEPSESESPAPSRDAIAVSVLNASSVAGLAASVGQQVTAAGWTVETVGNWQGAPAANAVHYPPGQEAAAELLAGDLGIAATAASLNGMSTERLTVLLITAP